MTYTPNATWKDKPDLTTPITAAKLNRLETGAANAVDRTDSAAQTVTGTLDAPLRDHGGQAYNVRSYGAAGDGTTNDAAAVQAASDAAAAAGGGVVYFPTGIYKVNTAISVILPSVIFAGAGWDQSTTTAGSILKAGASITSIVSASSAATKFSATDMSFDGAGVATNCITTDGLNSQFTRCHARNPAAAGVGFNVTANGVSAWFTDCRFNGANQTASVGWSIAATDSILTSCKGVNCLDSVQYQAGASGAIQQGCHHTPGSSIGRCAINMIGNSSRMQFTGNRIDNHALGSGIQLSPSGNINSVLISNNLFYQTAITTNTFAAIGVDVSTANIRALLISGNLVESSASHVYSALLTAQKLDGSAASNPTRIGANTMGTNCTGNNVYAAAMYGTSSSPRVARGNMLSTDGATYELSADIA